MSYPKKYPSEFENMEVPDLEKYATEVSGTRTRIGYLNQKELNRAQGFPEDYKFFGNKSSWGQQLANAVPVELGEAFAKAFARASV